MAKKNIGISLQIPADFQLTREQAKALGEAVKIKLATIRAEAPAANLLSLPETNIFLRQPRQPKPTPPADIKQASAKSTVKKS